MCAAPCRIAACLPLYVDGLCTSACAALGIQNGVPIAQTVWGRIPVAHWRFSRWRRFRMAFLQMASLPDKHENPTSRSSRRGILSFGNVPDAQVERLAKKFKAHPECLDLTRRRCYDIRGELWDRLSVTSMVGTYKFEHVSFTKLLREVTQQGPWRAELQKLFWQRPITSDSPLSLVIYGDELTPGNILRLNNNLKMMAWYFTVYEFAERFTRHEAMWLPLRVISLTECRITSEPS